MKKIASKFVLAIFVADTILIAWVISGFAVHGIYDIWNLWPIFYCIVLLCGLGLLYRYLANKGTLLNVFFAVLTCIVLYFVIGGGLAWSGICPKDIGESLQIVGPGLPPPRENPGWYLFCPFSQHYD